ncbi:MAG TPA: carboxypeptidase regulatory-like domain-containing protein [Acidobacteriaceae bacterium]|nr:carboxypeptidase regulatory-like domain-containing protein [Acidobacteriaceae bacterium]
MRFNYTRAVLAGLLALGCGLPALAQSTNATLSGVVHDAQGSVVPRATIQATNIQTGQSRETTSGDTGDYTVPDLAIGDYRITASAAGFKTLVIPSITLHVNQAAALDLKLEVGAVSEQVVVTTTLPLLNTENSSVGQVVQSQSIESQPLNGRSFWQLVALVPGASYTPGGEGTRTGGASLRSSVVNVQIDGTGFIWNGWLMDGADITEYEQGGTNIQPNVDALAEFKVFSANMPAEYGHTPNVVSVTMKSGTNAFHGTAYEFIRNDVIDAHNYFAITSKNILKRNQFGGTIGGPIKKDKVFFFSDIEASRQTQGVVFSDIVPSLAMRSGNFSGGKTITDPATGKPFPGNIIPANRISSQAAYFMNFLPTPTQATFSSAQGLDILKGDVKIDAALTGSDHLMGRYSIADNQETDPNPFPALKLQALHSRAQNIAFSETHLFGNRWLNEARASYYRDYFLFGAILQGTNYLQQAGITGYEQTQITPSFPYITMSGYTAFTGSGSGNFPKSNRIRTWEYADTVSYENGKHEVRLGGQMWVQRHSFYNGQGQEGIFTFTTEYTGDAFGDFLLGAPAQVYRSYPLTLYGNRGIEWAGFVQDNYHATSDLTFNVGLRWEYNPFFDGVDGQNSAFDPATGKVIVPTRNGQILNPRAQPETPLLIPLFSDRVIGTDSLGLPDSVRKAGILGQFVPRVGLAWRPGGSERMVVRAGYGLFPIFLDTNMTLQWAHVPPFLIQQTIVNSTGAPTFNWGNPFNGQSLVAANPHPGTVCPGTNLVLLSCVAPAISTAPRTFNHTYMEQYNLAMQFQLRKDMSLDVAYVGNHTLHGQLISVPVNTPNPGPGAVQARRPFPQWGPIGISMSNGIAHYNALQTSLEKRLSNGVYALVSYTYSKCTDNGSSESGPPTISLLAQNYGVCDYDITNNMTISSIYQLPFGRGRRFLSNANRAVDAALGGWEIAGIFMDRTGLPFTPTISSDVANTGVSGQWPNRVGSGALAHPTAQKWFDTSAFTIPAKYTYGNSRRDILRSDGLVDLDTTLKKNFTFTESKIMELRFESFNLANHPTFSAPNATIGSSSAGRVTSTLNANRIFQAAVKFFF